MGIQERLLAVMDAKNHWAFPSFTRPGSAESSSSHFYAEYMVYAREEDPAAPSA
jgi:hypothetical protein